MLLVPANTIVSQPNYRSILNAPDTLNLESYYGPARVFLPPGWRRFVVRVQGAGAELEFELAATFEPGKRYELSVVEDGERVAFELFELHPSSYAAIYPDD